MARKKNKWGLCRLCVRERRLCDSHIIPEFLYRPAYDTDGRMHSIRDFGKKSGFLQIGAFEPLLCSECEAFLNDTYEQPFLHFWLGDGAAARAEKSRNAIVSGIDYGPFKLFHLSILWRASVSQSRMFSQVSVGREHEERIRTMLVDQKPSSEDDYPLIATFLLDSESKIVFSSLMSPVEYEAGGKPLFSTVYGGCAWEIVISVEDGIDDRIKHRVLRDGQPMAFGAMLLTDFEPIARQHFEFILTAAERGWNLPWKLPPEHEKFMRALTPEQIRYLRKKRLGAD